LVEFLPFDNILIFIPSNRISARIHERELSYRESREAHLGIDLNKDAFRAAYMNIAKLVMPVHVLQDSVSIQSCLDRKVEE
jgi:hypothetical protein